MKGDDLEKAYNNSSHDRVTMGGSSSFHHKEIYNNDPIWNSLQKNLKVTIAKIVTDNSSGKEVSKAPDISNPVGIITYEEILRSLAKEINPQSSQEPSQ